VLAERRRDPATGCFEPPEVGSQKAIQDDHISLVDRFVLITTNERLIVFG
jgi:hypothetical protein